MPTVPPGLGIPGGPPIAFGHFALVWSVIALLLLAVTAAALWLLGSREARRYRVRCPDHGTTAIITVRTDEGGVPDVVHCSLCHPSDRIDCDRRCLRQMA